jgi:hypothetical protein
MFRSTTFLVYSHTEYDDILEINLKRHKKYFPEMPITICTNNKKFVEEKYKDDIESIIEYDADKPYGEKLAFVLSQIKTPFVIFNQEVNIFYDKVHPETIDKIFEFFNRKLPIKLAVAPRQINTSENPRENINDFLRIKFLDFEFNSLRVVPHINEM